MFIFLKVVKLGISSEQAKAFVENESESATKGLLSDYSITPGTNLPMRTPRTPAQQDNILQVGQLKDVLRRKNNFVIRVTYKPC